MDKNVTKRIIFLHTTLGRFRKWTLADGEFLISKSIRRARYSIIGLWHNFHFPDAVPVELAAHKNDSIN